MDTETTSVLVPLEGCGSDVAVLSLAGTLAARLGGGLILMRVVRPQTSPMPSSRLTSIGRGLLDDALLARTDAAVARAENGLRRLESTLPSVPALRVVLVGANPSRSVLDWLRRHPADLVVAASLPSSGVRRLMGTGLADRVARTGLARR